MKPILGKNTKGFTLLEIIIVVIIVGVLASLALPRLFSTVEFSRSTEAMAAIGTVRQAIERCMLRRGGGGDYVVCDTFAEVTEVPDPSNEPGAHFTYAIADTATGYKITATRTALDGGNVGDTIQVEINTTAKTIVKKGGAAFLNI